LLSVFCLAAPLSWNEVSVHQQKVK
jgi:hypothetical protein